MGGTGKNWGGVLPPPGVPIAKKRRPFLKRKKGKKGQQASKKSIIRSNSRDSRQPAILDSVKYDVGQSKGKINDNWGEE